MSIFKCLLIINLLIAKPVFSQSDETLRLVKCQQDWNYRKLDKELTAKIEFYEQPTEICGSVITASVAIVTTSEMRTLRILTICNFKGIGTEAKFKKGDTVKIIPSEPSKTRISLIPYDPEVCLIKEAYFGSISK
jgi:hypothetical protein